MMLTFPMIHEYRVLHTLHVNPQGWVRHDTEADVVSTAGAGSRKVWNDSQSELQRVGDLAIPAMLFETNPVP